MLVGVRLGPKKLSRLLVGGRAQDIGTRCKVPRLGVGASRLRHVRQGGHQGLFRVVPEAAVAVVGDELAEQVVSQDNILGRVPLPNKDAEGEEGRVRRGLQIKGGGEGAFGRGLVGHPHAGSRGGVGFQLESMLAAVLRAG